MTEDQRKHMLEAVDRTSASATEWENYWRAYSSVDTWQFWTLLLMLVLPLVALVLRLDRGKAFRIGFYGFAIHVIAIYSDLYATTHHMWAYPYKVFPFPPSSFSVDASLIPVAYMFLYQWSVNRRRNYYVYSALLGAAFAFGLKPLLAAFDMFLLLDTNYLLLFLFYLIGGWAAKWVTDLFAYAEGKQERGARRKASLAKK